ncbi:putative DNA-binding domain-containing protein [Endozoicomonas sp. GU-1]|uniref:HvfC family RiPP maturation protein n=1 Tax=Endozoicomonas sp. GU-1 TaxID=3009078 RepID=UPI0022B4A114|nr:putative DNA-binding domain-containing protein [Endozoicomonas sp. GU-1]WBA80814.1 putative DNA-binding domain-containing protein [Endozoicomonas sp. GU-1]WBA88375.1 putative DNA-binding domain-containing protein [Endozoicomonas sp. GU-1]
MDDFQIVQQQFTEAIRHQTDNPFEQIKPERFAVYSRLIRNNISNFVSQGFPVLKKLLPEEAFNHLVDRFIADHPASSPYFIDISGEFLAWLNTNPVTDKSHTLPPFLRELAHYEWLETLLLGNEQDEPPATAIAVFSDCEDALIWSVNAVAAAYQYPVHKISRDFQPQTAPEQPTLLIVYRQENETRFLTVDALAWQLFQTASTLDQPVNHKQLIKQTLQHLTTAERTRVKPYAEQALMSFYQLGLILGSL